MYANVLNASTRWGESTSSPISGSPSSIAWTIAPIGSSTSGIQSSSCVGHAGMIAAFAGAPRDLRGE